MFLLDLGTVSGNARTFFGFFLVVYFSFSSSYAFLDFPESQWRDRDTTQPGYIYGIERGYLSFDTSSIPDYAYIMGVKLELKLAFDGTQTDFLLQVWSGTGGTQYIYGNSLDAADWGWLVG